MSLQVEHNYSRSKGTVIISHPLHKQLSAVVLVGLLVDTPILMYALDSCNKLDNFSNIVEGFFEVFQNGKAMKRPGLSSNRQEYLCKHLAGMDYDAHDASSDVISRQSLTRHLNIDICNANDSCRLAFFTTASAVGFYKYSNIVQINLLSLQPLISKKIISTLIAKKVASSGLKYKHLELAFIRDPVEGIYSLFSEQCWKSVRVTKSKNVISQRES